MAQPALDVLLDLDGQVLVVDPAGGHWVRFGVTRAPVSAVKPHGVDYSRRLHGPDGERLVGFDNAAPRRAAEARCATGPSAPAAGSKTVRIHQDTVTLLADFWQAVDAVLRERGVIP